MGLYHIGYSACLGPGNGRASTGGCFVCKSVQHNGTVAATGSEGAIRTGRIAGVVDVVLDNANHRITHHSCNRVGSPRGSELICHCCAGTPESGYSTVLTQAVPNGTSVDGGKVQRDCRLATPRCVQRITEISVVRGAVRNGRQNHPRITLAVCHTAECGALRIYTDHHKQHASSSGVLRNKSGRVGRGCTVLKVGNSTDTLYKRPRH